MRRKRFPAVVKRNTACIFEKGYLQIRKPVYFSPFLNLEDDGEECREWEKLDNLPEEWEEAYDVNTETEILAYKK